MPLMTETGIGGVLGAFEPECVVPAGDHCGEAVLWVDGAQAIFWTDVNRFLVHRFVPSTRETKTWMFDQPCVSLAITDRPGTLLLGLGSGVFPWMPETGHLGEAIFQLEGWPATRMNDGRPGPGGELWIGSMANNVGPNGAQGQCEGFGGDLFRLRAGDGPRIFRRDIGISNTVCFSPCGNTLYFGDSKRNTIWRYSYDQRTQEISNETVFFEGFERGGPDGSAIDREGYLWNCRFGGGCIVRIAPDGSVDRIVEMPVSNVTTCDFGGADRKTLFITTASIELDHHERFAGGLFALRTDTQGMAPLKFRFRNDQQ
jgi:sugar lactone lactonase YvrE